VSTRGWLFVLLLLLLCGGGVFAWLRFEGTAPTVTGPEEIVFGADGGSVPLELSDAGTGLRSVDVVLAHAGGEIPLASETYPGGLMSGALRGEAPETIEVAIPPDTLPRGVSDAFLRVSVRDWSWNDGLLGNETQWDIPLTIDRVPPHVSIATGLTYIKRGGAAAVLYRLSEETVRDGVLVGETLFPSYPVGDWRAVVYAVPVHAPPNPDVRVLAEDRAGNVTRARWPVVVKERGLPAANVTLPASFLELTVPDLAAVEGIDAPDPSAAFKIINTDLRAQNEERIREIVSDSAPEKLWDGAFEQLENSQVTSRFAEERTYFVSGKPNSQATHYGYDLASTRAAPITAAASGRVLYAGPLGIYGNCVLVDHGLGVTTLYGHLSRVDVSAGDPVEQGQTLGLSGATGLAGGDHLHFAVLVGHTYVDPLEWWDAKWVRENVEARLTP